MSTVDTLLASSDRSLLLVDDDAVHQRDLGGGAAEAEQADAGEGADEIGEGGQLRRHDAA